MGFRIAVPADKAEVIALTRDIWDGEDYIGFVFDEWVHETVGEFTILEDEGRIVGFAKMTQVDHDAVWFEGLRVRSDSRGKGYGKALTDYQMRRAPELGYRKVLLATHSANQSVGIIEAQGFERIEAYKYFEVTAPTEGTVRSLEKAEDFPFPDGYVNLDFSFRRMDASLAEILKARGDIYRCGDARFVATNYHAKGNVLSLIGYEGPYQDVLEGLQALAREKAADYVSVMADEDAWIDFLWAQPLVRRVGDTRRDAWLYEKKLEEHV